MTEATRREPLFIVNGLFERGLEDAATPQWEKRPPATRFNSVSSMKSAASLKSNGWSSGGTLRSLGSPFRRSSTPKRELPATISTGNLGRHLREAAGSLPPQRVFQVLQALKEGLGACISLRESELGILRAGLETFSVDSLGQGKLFDLEKVKSSERVLKHLEYQLSRVEELGENFTVQLKLQQGASNLAVAYNQRRRLGSDALSSIRSDLKTLGQQLHAMEMETQFIMGSFQIHLNGIVGYARVRPGDVFEVTLRHGSQKWKARGKTGPDKTQAWDRTLASFSADPNTHIHIKACEVGLLGSTKTLAEQSCDPAMLLSPEPQTLTMDLNLHGTLKLNLTIHWMTVEPGLHSETISSRKSIGSPLMGALRREKSPAPSLGRSLLSSPSPQGGRRPVSVYYAPDAAQRPSLNILGPKNSLESSSSLSSVGAREPVSSASSSSSAELRRPSAQGTTIRYQPSTPTGTLSRRPPSGASPKAAGPTLLALLRALKPLAAKLRERQGQLEACLEILIQWDTLLKKAVLTSSLGSTASSAPQRRSTANLEAKLGRMGLTGRYAWDAEEASDGTQDSGFDSISHRFGSTPYLHDAGLHSPSPNELERSQGISPAQRKFRALKTSRRKSIGSGLEPASEAAYLSSAAEPGFASLPRSLGKSGGCGHSELDAALHHHLLRLRYLLQSLDEVSGGALRYRERELLLDLLGEVGVLENLYHLAASLPSPPRLDSVLRLLGGGGEAGELWEAAVVGMPTKLLAPAHLIRADFLKAYGHIIRAKYPDLVDGAFTKLMRWLCGGGGWEPGTLSVFQFTRAFRGHSLANFVESLGHETWICASLDSGLSGNVEHVMGRLRQVPVLPPLPCLSSVAALSVSGDASLSRPVGQYLGGASGQLRNDLINACIGFLEAPEERTRAGAARCLALLKARRSIGALGWVGRSDPGARVRDEARRALLTFGEEGRHALAEESVRI